MIQLTLFSLKKMETLPGNGSFITEHMIFNVEIMKALIKEIESNISIPGEMFYEKVMNAIDISALPLSGFSEFETYGTFVINRYADRYRYRKLKYLRNGRVFFGNHVTEKELEWASQSYDTISFEHFDAEWKFVSWMWRNSYVMNHKTLESLYERMWGRQSESIISSEDLSKNCLRGKNGGINMKILVTGASGFIGTNLVEDLIDKGYDVLNVDWVEPKINERKSVWKKADITHYDEFEKAVLDFSRII